MSNLPVRAVEKVIERFSVDGSRTFFDSDRFPWVTEVEAAFPRIRAELDALLVHRDRIPNFQDISEEQRVLTEADQWKTFVLYAYGKKADDNCRLCPETARALSKIPGMKTAMFSILAPGKHIPEHRGPWKGVLRYHLGLIVPEPSSQCRIRVGGDIRSWEEGKSLVFDDSHDHEVWNDASSLRVVLFVDFLRPLWFPLSAVNRAMVWSISHSGYITKMMKRVRAARAD